MRGTGFHENQQYFVKNTYILSECRLLSEKCSVKKTG